MIHCGLPMLDLGIWPQRDGTLAQGWKCPACGKLIKVPVERCALKHQPVSILPGHITYIANERRPGNE